MTPTASVAALGAAILIATTAGAQEIAPSAQTQQRLDEQSRRIQSLEAAVEELRKQPSLTSEPSRYETGYDKGFYIRGRNPETDPFSLKINGRMQFRYAGLAPDDRTYENLATEAVGIPVEVVSRNDFDIERARLSFEGTAVDKDLHFYINLDGDTDDNHQVIFHDFWFNYEFSRSFDLYAGKAFVPGSREWLMGSTATHLIDRSMATSFFRPDRSVGLWAIGHPSDALHYRAMVGNGFQTTDLDFTEINQDMAYSGTVWVEPSGPFGGGYADLKKENDLRLRFGSSLTYAKQDGLGPAGVALPESNFVRLDDGSRLLFLGVDHFNLTLLAVDAAMKYNGFSLHGEGYYRWLRDIGPTGPGPAGFPFDSNESYGGYVGAGYMLVPSKFDVQLRYSAVLGDFKNSAEYAGGFNYYIDGTHGKKLSLDLTHLDGSPISSSGPDFVVGDNGWLVRLQLQLSF